MAEIRKKTDGFKTADDFPGKNGEDDRTEKVTKTENESKTPKDVKAESFFRKSGDFEDSDKDETVKTDLSKENKNAPDSLTSESDNDKDEEAKDAQKSDAQKKEMNENEPNEEAGKTDKDVSGKGLQEFVRSEQLMRMSVKRKLFSQKSKEKAAVGDIGEPDSKTDRQKKDIPYGYVGLFGSRLVVPKIVLSLVRIIIPIIFVLVCRIVISGMLADSLENSTNIDGVFGCSQEGHYIDINGDGTYSMSGGDEGEWTLGGNTFKFASESGNVVEGVFIERKYIVLYDKNFYQGNVSQDARINATMTSNDGSSIRFDRDGNVFMKSDGFEEEKGTYVVDGSFISVTTADKETVIYIKCSDGISKIYYQI